MWSSATSSSWLNQGERWFRDLTDKNRCAGGIFGSAPDLIASIEKYMAVTNNSKPYVWTATAESILAKSSERAPSSTE